MVMPLDIKYEPTPNPKPLPFPATFVVRDEGRAEMIRAQEKKERLADPLLKGK